MECSNCGAQNPEEYQFCNKCGTSLRETHTTSVGAEPLVKIRICPKCGQMSPSYAWHCYACGETLGVSTIEEVKASEVHYPEEVYASKNADQPGMDNEGNRERSIRSIPDQFRQQTEYGTNRGFTTQTESSNSYGALRGIASLCRTLSNIVAVIAGFGAFLCLFIIGDNIVLGLGGIFFCVILGGFFYVILRIIAEGVSVILDIEVNSRQTSANTQLTVQLLKQVLSTKGSK